MRASKRGVVIILKILEVIDSLKGKNKMPIYEFECNECHKVFEKLCSMKEDLSRVPCEFCHKKNVRKKMSSFATGSQRNSLQLSGGDSHEHSHSHSDGCSCGSCHSHDCSCCH